MGSGYTVEGQKTGEEKLGGLRIKITPAYITGLRSWMSDTIAEPAPNDIFAYVKRLEETRTPAELQRKAGDILRQYPSKDSTVGPRQVSDMDDGSGNGEIQVEVRNIIAESC